MDAGIASASNIAWLIEHGYQYLVVSREGHAKDPRDQESAVMVRKLNTQRRRLPRNRCRNRRNPALLPLRTKSQKEQAIRNRFHVRLEEGLDQLNAGLDKKGTTKNYAKILERIGRLRGKKQPRRARLQY